MDLNDASQNIDGNAFGTPGYQETEAKEKDHQEETKQAENVNKPEEAKDADDDWTLLDKSQETPGASASPEPEILGAGAIYPKLDVPDLSGLNPKVQVALQAMENMGFTKTKHTRS